MIEYKIISSGSVGNAVKLTFQNGIKMMIDIGLSYKALKNELQDCHLLFVSHIHSDHLNVGCYNQIRKNQPWVKVIACEEVNELVISKGKKPVDIIVTHGSEIEVSGVKCTFLDAPHEVQNLGIIGESDGQTFLYSTDLMTTFAFSEYLDNVGKTIDLLLLEANYDPAVIGYSEYMKIHSGYDTYNNGSYRHLSTVANKQFAEKYLSAGGVSIPLHKSGSYYSYRDLKDHQDLDDSHDNAFIEYCKERGYDYV
ncbi:beta-lactamase superfamily domain protein [Enterococcus phage Phi_Eg_SY1]|nr:beta-lactamase superfamily domain protein [Enterococcus phage Phi_Eg_SY1]